MPRATQNWHSGPPADPRDHVHIRPSKEPHIDDIQTTAIVNGHAFLLTPGLGDELGRGESIIGYLYVTPHGGPGLRWQSRGTVYRQEARIGQFIMSTATDTDTGDNGSEPLTED